MFSDILPSRSFWILFGSFCISAKISFANSFLAAMLALVGFTGFWSLNSSSIVFPMISLAWSRSAIPLSLRWYNFDYPYFGYTPCNRWLRVWKSCYRYSAWWYSRWFFSTEASSVVLVYIFSYLSKDILYVNLVPHDTSNPFLKWDIPFDMKTKLLVPVCGLNLLPTKNTIIKDTINSAAKNRFFTDFHLLI